MILYFFASISIVFTSMVIGAIINGMIEKKAVYNYFSNLQFIKEDFVYKIIGIKCIKWLVYKTFWEKFNPNIRSKSKPRLDELISLKHEMTKAEVSHLIAFVIVVLVSFVVLKYILKFMLILNFINIVFNLYPALLQQMNKKRVDSLIKMKKLNTK